MGYPYMLPQLLMCLTAEWQQDKHTGQIWDLWDFSILFRQLVR